MCVEDIEGEEVCGFSPLLLLEGWLTDGVAFCSRPGEIWLKAVTSKERLLP